jgi:hypothetical protein
MMTRMLCLLTVLALPGSVRAGELLDPKTAWEAMQEEISEARRSRDYAKARDLRLNRPTEHLAEFEKSGGSAEGEERLYLARIYQAAQRLDSAMDAFAACAGDERLTARRRPEAVAGVSTCLSRRVKSGEIGVDVAAAPLLRIEILLNGMEGPGVATLRSTAEQRLAYVRQHLGHRSGPTAGREAPRGHAGHGH